LPYHPGEIRTGGFEHRFEILHYLFGLPFDIAGFNFAGFGHYRNLPGSENHAVDFYGLRIGPDGGRSFVSGNNFSGHLSLLRSVARNLPEKSDKVKLAKLVIMVIILAKADDKRSKLVVHVNGGIEILP